MNLIIDTLKPKDWPSVRAIFQEGIDTGQATFETAVPSWELWDAGKLTCCRLAGRLDGRIVGWVALSPVSKRKVYAGVAEVSVYIAANARGKGVGKILLKALIKQAEHSGLWMLQAVLFPENEASVALHETCGFRQVGTREKIARLHGIWRDTVLMERRSKTVGYEVDPY